MVENSMGLKKKITDHKLHTHVWNESKSAFLYCRGMPLKLRAMLCNAGVVVTPPVNFPK